MGFPRALIGLVAAALLSSCVREQDCTAMGMVSAVRIVLPSQEWSLLEFCVDQECLPAGALVAGDAMVLVSDEPGEYSYRARMVQPDGTELLREGTVTTEPFRVNGSGCDPLTANVNLVIDEAGDVNVAYP